MSVSRCVSSRFSVRVNVLVRIQIYANITTISYCSTAIKLPITIETVKRIHLIGKSVEYS